MQQVRFDPVRKIYRDCKWCGGKGCLSCEGEAEKEYNRQFPNGPEPMASFKTDDPKQMEALKRCLSATVLNEEFGPNGKGVDGIQERITAERKAGNIQ